MVLGKMSWVGMREKSGSLLFLVGRSLVVVSSSVDMLVVVSELLTLPVSSFRNCSSCLFHI